VIITERRILIVDAVKATREHLADLSAKGGCHVTAYESAERFMSGHRPEAPGCLLLGVNLPGMNGLQLQRQLAQSAHPRPIIFVTGPCDIQTAVSAMKAGAIDFLTEPFDPLRLMDALDAAFKSEAAHRDDQAIHRLLLSRITALTPREDDVMRRIVAGRLNKLISVDLDIKEKTVKVHRARVMDKMGAASVAELVRMAARMGVATEPTLGAWGRLSSMEPTMGDASAAGNANAGSCAVRRESTETQQHAAIFPGAFYEPVERSRR
jgi:FixJ family two-component response regulator